jgi:flagellar protein FliT
MSASQVIANYESLLTLTRQMREAAVQGDWDALIGIEQRRGELVAAIKPLDAQVQLDEATRQAKNQLIHKILADEAEIRHHTQTWMTELQNLLQSNRQEQRLHQAYGV